MAESIMSKKTKIGCVLGLLSVLITQPLWFWLLYQILVRVQASELMWFLYWVYVPFALTLSILFKAVEIVFADDKTETNK
jgi:hypothetical protein